MKYFSLNNRTNISSFENAVIRGIAPDKGLYFPESIPKLSSEIIQNSAHLSKQEIAYEIIKEYIGDEIPRDELEKIISNTINFNFPVEKIGENCYVLELFHGPTLAFKDVGAKFMAGCLGYFVQKIKKEKVTVLVATSGDTGGAVANGFLGVEGIDVVILYPKGKVSELQEKQLTTLGKNITALEVEGNFDDCQKMVKQAFLDAEITKTKNLTSANSINVARWLPQMLYYFFAYHQLQDKNQKLAFSVPSGNYGNICAGLMAKKMGLPIDYFIAASNENNIIARYLETGILEPKPSFHTISNAMDVGDPSNFIRVLEIFQNKFDDLKEVLFSYSYNDEATKTAMKKVYDSTSYILDPHGAVGYLGLKEFLKSNPECLGVFLETAHPVKFLPSVESTLERKIDIPQNLQELMKKEKRSISIASYNELKEFLLN